MPSKLMNRELKNGMSTDQVVEVSAQTGAHAGGVAFMDGTYMAIYQETGRRTKAGIPVMDESRVRSTNAPIDFLPKMKFGKRVFFTREEIDAKYPDGWVTNIEEVQDGGFECPSCKKPAATLKQLRNHMMGFHRNDYTTYYREAMEERLKLETKDVDFMRKAEPKLNPE